jgi:hypothetical protein
MLTTNNVLLTSEDLDYQAFHRIENNVQQSYSTASFFCSNKNTYSCTGMYNVHTQYQLKESLVAQME